MRERLVSLVVALGALGVMVVLANGDDGHARHQDQSVTIEPVSAAELWADALADLTSAGGANYRKEFDTYVCPDEPTVDDVPCKVGRNAFVDHGSFTFEPLTVSWSRTRGGAGVDSPGFVGATRLASDGQTYFWAGPPDDPDADCWVQADPRALRFGDSALPYGIQVLLEADVDDDQRVTSLPVELDGVAPAQLVVGLIDEYAALVGELSMNAMVPVHLRVDANGRVAGVAADGAEVVTRYLELIRSGDVPQPKNAGLLSVSSERVDLVLSGVGDPDEVEVPDDVRATC